LCANEMMDVHVVFYESHYVTTMLN
jgi:hypothetical protein